MSWFGMACGGLVCLGTLLVWVDPLLAVIFALVVAAVAAPSYLLPLRREHQWVLLCPAAYIAITYLVRPLVLLPYPERFLYSRIGDASIEILVQALMDVGLYAFVFLLMCGVTFLLMITAGTRGTERARSATSNSDPLLLRIYPLVAIAISVVLVAKVVAVLGLGIGVRGAEANPALGYLTRLIPDALVYPVVLLYLLKYRERLPRFATNWAWCALIAAGGVTLLQGSKASVAFIVLALFIYAVYHRGRFGIRPARSLAVAVATATLIVASFIVGMYARAAQLGVPNFVGQAVRAFDLTSWEGGGLVVADLVTRRLIGFDGLVATDLSQPSEVLTTFSPSILARNVVAQLIPFYSSGSMTTGKAVGVYYGGVDPDVAHAGGLGIFGASRLLSRGRPVVALALFGIVWGLLCGLVYTIPSSDARFVIAYTISFVQAFWIMSGNIDTNTALMAVRLGQVVAVVVGIHAIAVLASRARAPVNALRTTT